MPRAKMRAIDYNIWMTLTKLLRDRTPSILTEYNVIADVKVEVAYPRDLAKMHKPSIIIRKVDTDQSKVAMGNFIGQLLDTELGYVDVSGMQHEIMIQFDIVGNGNIETSMLLGIISEDIFNNIMIEDGGRFQLYDFTKDVKNPTAMGVVTISDTPYITSIPDGIARPNSNNDYISVIRMKFTVIQTVIPSQESVDLSKWIKQSITIKGGN